MDGGYVAMIQKAGVTVRNLLTGKERWYYREAGKTDRDHYKGTYVARVEAGGGWAGVLLYPHEAGGRRELKVFDLATGRVLWTHRLPSEMDTDEFDLYMFRETVILGSKNLTGYRATDGK